MQRLKKKRKKKKKMVSENCNRMLMGEIWVYLPVSSDEGRTVGSGTSLFQGHLGVSTSTWLINNWFLQQYHNLTCKASGHTYWIRIFISLINIYWQRLFDAGALAQTNSLGMPLSRAWGHHLIAIAITVYPYSIRGTHTKHWQTAK